MTTGGAVSIQDEKRCRQYYQGTLTPRMQATRVACGRLIRAARKTMGDGAKMSQATLAQLAHVSRRAVNQLERGKQFPSLEALLRIADVLLLDYGHLLGDTGLSPALARLAHKLERLDDAAFVAHLEALTEDALRSRAAAASSEQPDRCA